MTWAMVRVATVIVSIGGAAATACAGGLATFQGLGSLDGTRFESRAYGVTDERVVAWVTSLPDGGYGTALTEVGGATRVIGPMWAWGLTPDATTVVGQSFGTATKPQYWTETSGITTLPVLGSGGFTPAASGVSADGRVIVGVTGGTRVAGSTSPVPSRRAVRWQDGVARDLGSLAGTTGGSNATDVSADGGVVVGMTDVPQPGGSAPVFNAFRWTEAEGMVSLGELPGGQVSSGAAALSADGRVVAGTSAGANGWEAFRWTAESGMVGLGRPAGTDRLDVRDMSGDGSVIAGNSAQVSGGSMRAAVWSEARGWRDVKSMLVGEYGLDLTGWTLRVVLGVSPDGKAIVGEATNPSGQTEAWVAVVPELGAKVGDANADGRVDGDDYVLIDRGFARGVGRWSDGDFDGDGVVGRQDYLLMDAAYGRQEGVLSPGLLARREAVFGAGYVGELTAAVPEPVGGGLLLACGVLVGGKRRRRVL